ncbi:unnamed protein product [Symbiodinium sp. CCMP2456]|nr:unnamed protein product [Symbiodinium sp. CCMP2456]
MAHVDAQKLYSVYANVYDVTRSNDVKLFKAVFAHCWAPVKFGGIFHVGVQVGSTEWAFGKMLSSTKPGVFGIPPRQDTLHSYRKTIFVGYTNLSQREYNAMIRDIVEDDPGTSYDVLQRNCIHFAEDFCHRLKLKALPEWISRFARYGSSTAENVSETPTWFSSFASCWPGESTERFSIPEALPATASHRQCFRAATMTVAPL